MRIARPAQVLAEGTKFLGRKTDEVAVACEAKLEDVSAALTRIPHIDAAVSRGGLLPLGAGGVGVVEFDYRRLVARCYANQYGYLGISFESTGEERVFSSFFKSRQRTSDRRILLGAPQIRDVPGLPPGEDYNIVASGVPAPWNISERLEPNPYRVVVFHGDRAGGFVPALLPRTLIRPLDDDSARYLESRRGLNDFTETVLVTPETIGKYRGSHPVLLEDLERLRAKGFPSTHYCFMVCHGAKMMPEVMAASGLGEKGVIGHAYSEKVFIWSNGNREFSGIYIAKDVNAPHGGYGTTVRWERGGTIERPLVDGLGPITRIYWAKPPT